MSDPHRTCIKPSHQMWHMERVLSPAPSDNTEYFDAPQMKFFPTTRNSSIQNNPEVIQDDNRLPNGDCNGSTEFSTSSEAPQKAPGSTASPKRSSSTMKPNENSRPPSLQSLPVWNGDRGDDIPFASSMGVRRSTSLGRKSSVRTARSSRTTRSVTGATVAFQNGATLTGPNAEPDVDSSVISRGSIAERSLTEKQKQRIKKDEQRESKRLSKLLKTESTSEKAALAQALKTLGSLQDLHKSACKRESKAQVAHSKSLLAAQKGESTFYEANARAEQERARWEGKQAEVRAQEERLEAERETVREMENRVAECAREVEKLRIMKATDEREREVKLTEMLGKKK